MVYSVSFPLLPLIVAVLLVFIALYFKQRLGAVVLIVLVTGLYAEHYNRQILRKDTCLEHATFQINGKPEAFSGIYVQLSRKYTWAELDAVFRELPLNRYGKSASPLTFVDADIAKSNFYEPQRHRFAREVFHSNKICWPRPSSPWLDNETFLEIHERLKRAGTCFRITPVKALSEVKQSDCWGNSNWNYCAVTEATQENLSIPTFKTERKNIEVVAWPSQMPAEVITRSLEASDGSWSAQSTTVQYGQDLDSWLSQLTGWFSGSRTVANSCFGRPLLPTVYHMLKPENEKIKRVQ
ncbi:hypothetical protein [Kordiimonas lacus]|uniref:Uncharacterized protein n=1 Tax=Kordiimonas lacus TaxID=637679 RepID=A0A1G6ZRY7_9PROT|nr:hypothetical protein [Kordiimonas lacus]SDE05282.1 hypothetical protein SAMN04488071_1924 [Kordiimonas lacus]